MVDEEKTKTKQETADKEAKEKGQDKAEAVEPEMKSTSKEVWDWAVQNDSKPLWTRSPKEVRSLPLPGLPAHAWVDARLPSLLLRCPLPPASHSPSFQ